MTFGQPLWLWAFALLPLLLLLFIRQERQRTGLLRRLVAARLAPRLAGSVSPGKRRLAFAFLLVGTAGVLAALAQPRWGFTWDERKGRGRDVLIAIDVSRSMLANDLTPNRLTRVKLAAEDLIGQLPGDRVGIIAFAGSAFLQAPLTADHSAVLTSLRELDVNVIPRGGTNIADAIRVAKEAVGVGEGLHRALVLFTDGEELGADGVEAAKGASGIMRMFTVGAGSPEGTVIALPNAAGSSGYLKDPEGRIVKSKLDDVRLRAIAEATGGFYLRLQQGAPEMRQLAEEGLGKMSDQEIDTTISKQPIERYQWPLVAGTLLLASSLLVGERRRRPLAAATAGVLVLFAPLAHGRNSAAEAWDRKDYAASLESFSKQAERRPEVLALEYGRGTAAYKAGRYDEAVEAFGRALCSPDTRLRTKAEYNLGNTLYQQGAGEKEPEGKMQWWRDAVKRYDQALEFEPKHADAAHNREIVRKLLEELEKKKEEGQKEEKKRKKRIPG